tara:strand:+ start:10995 stop:11309 length:315 start_codon:yes stop_codon:yes gene_type:complete
MKNLRAFLLVSAIATPCVATADIWAEREALAKIESEVAALEALVSAAEAQSNPAYRTTFEYRVLLADLNKIRKGITHHLTVPMEPVFPSTIDALSSEYTEVSKK